MMPCTSDSRCGASGGGLDVEDSNLGFSDVCRSTDGIGLGMIYEEMGPCNLFCRFACAGAGE